MQLLVDDGLVKNLPSVQDLLPVFVDLGAIRIIRYLLNLILKMFF
jgi:hypothetical protein